MSGLGDGVLADGVIGESSAVENIVITPDEQTITYSVNGVTLDILNNVAEGECFVTFSSRQPTITFQ
jgi:hypothetical protein